MKKLTMSSLAILALTTCVVLLSPFATAQDDEKQTIVISLTEDPLTGDPEPACVALQLGTGLIMSKKADVTIFATLGGVAVATKDALDSTRLCEKVSSDGKLQPPVALADVLETYLDKGGDILACPLCWVVRYGDLPGSGGEMIPSGKGKGKSRGIVYADSPVSLLLQADKVITY